MLVIAPAAPAEAMADLAGGCCAMASRMIGLVFVWSKPCVLRIDGLSTVGSKGGALAATAVPSWTDFAARAV